MVKFPLISVVITEYNQRGFLKVAVESAIRQTLSREQYEIIVTTKEENIIDYDYFDMNNVKVIRSQTPMLGKRISEALSECTGEIICLLEDDDVWDHFKLERVVMAFGMDDSIGYYHNAHERIAKTPLGLDNFSYCQNHDNRMKVIDIKEDSATISEIIDNERPDFNNSSISISHAILSKYATTLSLLNGAIDTFLFYISLMSGRKIVVDPSPLTYYRIGTGVTTSIDHKKKTEYISLRLRTVQHEYFTFLKIRDIACGEPLSNIVNELTKYQILVLSIHMEILGTGSDLTNRAKLVESIITERKRFKFRTIFYFLLIAISSISRWVSLEIYIIWHITKARFRSF